MKWRRFDGFSTLMVAGRISALAKVTEGDVCWFVDIGGDPLCTSLLIPTLVKWAFNVWLGYFRWFDLHVCINFCRSISSSGLGQTRSESSLQKKRLKSCLGPSLQSSKDYDICLDLVETNRSSNSVMGVQTNRSWEGESPIGYNSS